jgi:hypothetical protein
MRWAILEVVWHVFETFLLPQVGFLRRIEAKTIGGLIAPVRLAE